MQLDEFYDYKNQLMHDLLTNETIVKLISEDATVDTAKSLAYTRVFPCEYIPDTVEHGDTYICFDVDIERAYNKTYLLPTLYIWVMTHKSKIRLKEGGVRTDAICSEIAKIINGSYNYGLGRLELHSVDRFAPITDYNGKAMVFYATEFNTLSPNKHTVPHNRKGG